jgi:hypothetical protein
MPCLKAFEGLKSVGRGAPLMVPAQAQHKCITIISMYGTLDLKSQILLKRGYRKLYQWLLEVPHMPSIPSALQGFGRRWADGSGRVGTGRNMPPAVFSGKMSQGNISQLTAAMLV